MRSHLGAVCFADVRCAASNEIGPRGVPLPCEAGAPPTQVTGYPRRQISSTAMAYSHDYQISARRHMKAADHLYVLNTGGAQPGAKAVAGYLYGLAGELAVKQMMIQSGMRPLVADNRRDDPFYKHFPELKTFLQTTATGRRAGELLKMARTTQTFQEWSTDMRYAPTQEVPAARVDGWQEDAKKLMGQMEEQ